MTEYIEGGYYIKARCIQNSAISEAPPHVREIWDWLLKEANHASTPTCHRGQCVRRYRDIQEGLKWYVGYRKMMYKNHDCENAMKWLKKAGMITTTKTTRGLVITVCNYERYQDPTNYESRNGHAAKAAVKPQSSRTINKNGKNVENEKKVKPEAQVDWGLVLGHWNSLAKKYALPKMSKITEPRKKKYLSRTNGGTQDGQQAFWTVVERETPQLADWCLGKGERKWKIDFDFIVRGEDTFTKLDEGKYRKSEDDGDGEYQWSKT